MSQAQGMVEDDLVGGVKQKVPTEVMTVLKTIPAASGRDGPKEGMLRNHCENLVEEGIANEKAEEGVFKMPKVPRRTPEKKGNGREAGVQGDGEGGLKGEKVCALRVFLVMIEC